MHGNPASRFYEQYQREFIAGLESDAAEGIPIEKLMKFFSELDAELKQSNTDM